MNKQEELQKKLIRLSTERSYNACLAVASTIDAMSPEEGDLSLLRVGVLRNFTVEPLLPVLKGELARSGLFLQFYLSNYGNILPEVIAPDSGLFRFQPDVIIVAQWLELVSPLLSNRFLSFSPEQVQAETARVVNEMDMLLRHIRCRVHVPVLINNFPLPDYVPLGIFDHQREDMQVYTLRKLQQDLLKLSHQHKDVYVVDYGNVFSRIGYQQGFDERYWQIGKAPLSRHILFPLGIEYVKYLRALKGKACKLLVLDCDNTLWGGVVGEDGIGGIVLGKEFPGSCYVSFQQEILNLHDRGVILALCSKNNEHDVMEVLRTHPEMLLREEHFSAKQINWNDKVSNIQRIVEDLNIGMDSVVFADDSAYEIGFIRTQLPQVKTVQLPAEPHRLRTALYVDGYFDALVFSQEDRQRTKMYRDDAKRQQLSQAVGSVEEYLQQLHMEAVIEKPDKITVGRVAQLTQKTNQFNLTSRRYTEGDVSTMIQHSGYDVWHIRLKDNISDMGIVGVVIVKYYEQVAEIDTFLLSCRVLGRGVELVLLAYIIDVAKMRGCQMMKGRYIPSSKNGQVEGFYRKNGFTAALSDGEDAKSWIADLSAIKILRPAWLHVMPEVKNGV